MARQPREGRLDVLNVFRRVGFKYELEEGMGTLQGRANSCTSERVAFAFGMKKKLKQEARNLDAFESLALAAQSLALLDPTVLDLKACTVFYKLDGRFANRRRAQSGSYLDASARYGEKEIKRKLYNKYT